MKIGIQGIVGIFFGIVGIIITVNGIIKEGNPLYSNIAQFGAITILFAMMLLLFDDLDEIKKEKRK